MRAYLKEQSNEFFDHQFFIIQTYLDHWPTGSSSNFKFEKRPEVSDPWEIDSPGYQTPGSYVWSEFYYSPGSDTQGSQIFELKILITRRILNLNKIENILSRW